MRTLRAAKMLTADDPGWRVPARPTRRLLVRLYPEDGGAYSAVVPSLPGAATWGFSLGHAVEMAREAVGALLESYAADGRAVPWRVEAGPAESPCFERYIFVADPRA